MAGFAPEVLALLDSMGLQAPMGMGEKFFVNGGADGVTTGVNAVGRGSKDRPFLSIAYALPHCVRGRNDYIFCTNTNHQDEAASIEIPSLLDNVHIIGLAMPGCSPLELNVTGDYPAFMLNPGVLLGPVRCLEIAGFTISGGPTHGGIEVDGACDMIWIHHCSFGHNWGAGSQDGIRFNGISVTMSPLIEDNWFYGTSGPRGRLTQFGITGLMMAQGAIRRNHFVRVPTGAISLLGGFVEENAIEDNIIGCGADALGNAITLGAPSRANVVAHNEAQFGQAVMTNNPYNDLAGATDNDWISNQLGIAIHWPTVAV